jgi:hypothetical protein
MFFRFFRLEPETVNSLILRFSRWITEGDNAKPPARDGERETRHSATLPGRAGVLAAGERLLPVAVDLATGIWRIRRRMLKDGSEGGEAIGKAFRYVESAWDSLGRAKIEVRDHDGERYSNGMAVKVLAFQLDGGLSRETVVETIKPSVYYQDVLVQWGEVIVGVPPKAESERPTGAVS